MANKRREDYIKRNNTIAMVVLGIALVAIFLTSSDFGKEILKRFTGDNKAPSITEVKPVAQPGNAGNLQAYFVDIGQGDCELVRIPASDGGYFNMLIDSGTPESADDLVEFIKGLGISRLDAVVATHPHADHIGGMKKILDEFEVTKFYMPRISNELTPTTATYEKMLDALTAKNLGITVLKAGGVIPAVDTATVSVLAPGEGEAYDNLNNYSAVIKVSYGENSMVFMGDAEKDEFTAAMDKGYNMSADLIKVGHHGSENATNQKLLTAVSPGIAVISCGKDNDYGHPHKEVVELLEKNKVQLLRTDLQGTILVESDGKTLKVA